MLEQRNTLSCCMRSRLEKSSEQQLSVSIVVFGLNPVVEGSRAKALLHLQGESLRKINVWFSFRKPVLFFCQMTRNYPDPQCCVIAIRSAEERKSTVVYLQENYIDWYFNRVFTHICGSWYLFVPCIETAQQSLTLHSQLSVQVVGRLRVDEIS